MRFHPEDTVLPAGAKLRLVFAGSDAYTEIEGTMWAGELSRGMLSLPVVERDWDAVRLDVPVGEPISS